MTRTNKTRPIHIWHDPFMCAMTQSFLEYVSWGLGGRGGESRKLYDVTHSCMTRLKHMRRMWHDSFKCDTMTHAFMTWLIRTWPDSCICDMTHLHAIWRSHMWHDSFLCDMTHACVTWLIRMWHDSVICDMIHSYVTWLMHMWHDSFKCEMTHSYVTRRTHVRRDLTICS